MDDRQPTNRKAGRGAGRNRSRRWHGFTLIEVMVAVVLVSVGVVGVFGGIRALGIADSRARMAQRLQTLAMDKMNELGPVTDPSNSNGSGNFADTSGNFYDQGYPDANWTMTLETTDTENLDKITVTVTEGTESQTLVSLIYIPAATGTSTGTTGGTGGGAGT